MRRIILFRFYKFPLVCLNRLKILKAFNPEVPIYGIYGGDENDFAKYQKRLNAYLEDCYCIKDKTKEWKWKHFDLALIDWYRDFGQHVNFDMLYTIEWDLLFLDKLEHVYANINIGEVGISGLIPLSKIEHSWYWTSKEPFKSEWQKLMKLVKKEFNYSYIPYGSLGPGTCMPKKFLEKYSQITVPELCHDEIRFPLFAQIFKFRLKNTGFQKKWFNKSEYIYFNCIGSDIDIEVILQENKARKRLSFHPFKKLLKIEELLLGDVNNHKNIL